MKQKSKHPTIEKDVKIVMDYIKEYPEGVELSCNKISEIASINNTYASNVYKELRDHKDVNIIKLGGRSKRTLFKYTGGEKQNTTPIITKYECKKGDYFTPEQKEYLINALEKASITDKSRRLYMSILNILAGKGATIGYAQNFMGEVSDLVLLSSSQIRLYLDHLSSLGLIESKCKYSLVKITFNGTEVYESREIPFEELESEVPAEPEVVPTAEELTIEQPNSTNEVVNSLISFKDFIEQFQGYLDGKIVSIGNPELVTQLQSKNVQLTKQQDEGNKAIDKLLLENQQLKGMVSTLTEQNKQSKKEAYAYRAANENLFEVAQQRLQVLLADVNTTIVKFTSTPAWQMSPSVTAKTQGDVLQAITSAMEDILKANKTVSNEE